MLVPAIKRDCQKHVEMLQWQHKMTSNKPKTIFFGLITVSASHQKNQVAIALPSSVAPTVALT